MAGRSIEVNTNTLKSDLSVIEEEIRGINRGAGQLEQALHALESMWEGPAKESFSAAVNDDIRRLRELSRLLESFTQTTGEVRQEYDACENEIAQLITSIRV